MSRRYPRIRRYAKNGNLLVREGVILCFFMHCPHGEVTPAVMQALESYCRAVGPNALGWYPDMNGDWQLLDEAGWEHARRTLRETPGATVELDERPDGVSAYRFEYHGDGLATPWSEGSPDGVSAVSCWLPVEYLEEHGPGRVRDLAVELARALPLNSGYASLSFNASTQLLGVLRAIREVCFEYPGLDVQDLAYTVRSVGTKVRGAYWLNFYGQPLLGQLGGAADLHARLSREGITVEELGDERVLVSLGEWPESGDETGALEPYRALARLLEPHLYEERIDSHQFPREEMHRWLRRFLA